MYGLNILLVLLAGGAGNALFGFGETVGVGTTEAAGFKSASGIASVEGVGTGTIDGAKSAVGFAIITGVADTAAGGFKSAQGEAAPVTGTAKIVSAGAKVGLGTPDVSGVGEIVANVARAGDLPALWTGNVGEVGLAPAPGGGLVVSSNGATWNRLQTQAPMVAGERTRVRIVYRAGSSGQARISLRNDAGGTETVLSGPAGALTVQQTGFGAVQILEQRAEGGALTLEVAFLPNASVGNAGIGIGPNSTATGADVVIVSAWAGVVEGFGFKSALVAPDVPGTGAAETVGSKSAFGTGTATGIGIVETGFGGFGFGETVGVGTIVTEGFKSVAEAGDVTGAAITGAAGHKTGAGAPIVAGEGATAVAGIKSASGLGVAEGAGSTEATGAKSAEGFGIVVGIGQIDAVGFDSTATFRVTVDGDQRVTVTGDRRIVIEDE